MTGDGGEGAGGDDGLREEDESGGNVMGCSWMKKLGTWGAPLPQFGSNRIVITWQSMALHGVAWAWEGFAKTAPRKRR